MPPWAKPALIAAPLVVALWASASAQAFVYWANSADGTIGRANNDGTGVRQSFITGATIPRGVAVDGSHIYWTNYDANAIGRAKLNGDPASVDQEFVEGSGFASAMAVDGGHLYWASGSNVGRANLDGSGVTPGWITGASDAAGVAVTSEHVYWSNNALAAWTLGRADIDGDPASVDQGFITGAAAPVGVAVDSAHLYWANRDLTLNSIGRSDLDGTPASINQGFIGSASSPRGVAVGANGVYWTHEFPDSIAHANLNGTGTVPELIPVSGAEGVAVDDLSLPGCQKASASTDHAQPIEIALSCTAGGGTRRYAIVSGPTHGRATGLNASTGRLKYTPDPGFSGTDSFRFRASNQGGPSAPATATVEVEPSNEFTIGKAKRNKRRGTAKLNVEVPGPGELALGGKGVKEASASAGAAGEVTLRVKPTRKVKRRLARRGAAKVRPDVSYTPTGGDSKTLPAPMKLKLR